MHISSSLKLQFPWRGSCWNSMLLRMRETWVPNQVILILPEPHISNLWVQDNNIYFGGGLNNLPTDTKKDSTVWLIGLLTELLIVAFTECQLCKQCQGQAPKLKKKVPWRSSFSIKFMETGRGTQSTSHTQAGGLQNSPDENKPDTQPTRALCAGSGVCPEKEHKLLSYWPFRAWHKDHRRTDQWASAGRSQRRQLRAWQCLGSHFFFYTKLGACRCGNWPGRLLCG